MEENNILCVGQDELCEQDIISDDDVLDADIQARILEMQLKLEAEYEASDRLSAEEAELARQEQEELLCREQAKEVIDAYQARRNLIASSSVRGWRDSMYDDIVPYKESFWSKWGDRLYFGLLTLFCTSSLISAVIYQELTRLL